MTETIMERLLARGAMLVNDLMHDARAVPER